MDPATAKEGDFGVDLEAGVVDSLEEAGLIRDSITDVESLGRQCHMVCGAEDKVGKEKRKKSSNKKASKPPRPPRAPSLDATDQKLIKEIAEFAMLKRSRMERMKALKKEKNAKAGSASASSGNAIALVFTVLFIFGILFHGCSPSTKPSVTDFEGSTKSAGFLGKGPISSHYSPIPLAGDDHGASYGTPRSLTEQAVHEKRML